MPVQSSAYNPPIPQTPGPLDYSFGSGWSPDMPTFGNPGSPNARNVVPRTPNSFGPVPSLVPVGTALSGPCVGAAAFLDNNGAVTIFAGTKTDLFMITNVTATWQNISKAPAAYGVPNGQFWNFEFFNGVVIACDGNDNTQSYTIGTSTTFNDLAGGVAPRGKYITVARNFLFLADTQDNIVLNPNYETNHQRIWWSPLNNPFSAWPTPGSTAAITVQSSFDDIYGKQGWCQGIVGNLGNADIAVFFEHAVFRGIYSGPPDFFAFLPALGAKGCPAPQSIVQLGSNCFYLGEDGFYGFDGMNSSPIGANQVDKTVYADMIPTLINRTVGSVDPVNKLIYWAYCGAGSTGTPNRLLAWNWQLNAWSIIDVATEYVVRLLTLGYTLDELYTILGYTVDTVPYPLGSRIWSGGLLTFGAFTTANKLAFLNGPNMAAQVDTAESQPYPGQRTIINDARPWIDGGTPSIAIGKRERMNDPIVFGSAVAQNSLGTCPVMTSGRYLSCRITTRTGDVWQNLIGIEVDTEAAGNQ